jgi:hypothetical protein
MTREQEDNIMGWGIVLMMVLFIGALCTAQQNIDNQSQTSETP